MGKDRFLHRKSTHTGINFHYNFYYFHYHFQITSRSDLEVAFSMRYGRIAHKKPGSCAVKRNCRA